MATLSPQEKEMLARAIAKGIAYTENGGKPDIQHPSAGQSGEMKSIFQYTPNTWHAVAAKYLGSANTPLNPDTETTATIKRIEHWLDEGYNVPQIGSMWNAGEGRPNAYKENWKGVNAEGVSYDTPAYAKKMNDYSKEFYAEMQQKATPQIAQAPAQPLAAAPAPVSQGLLPAAASNIASG